MNRIEVDAVISECMQICVSCQIAVATEPHPMGYGYGVCAKCAEKIRTTEDESEERLYRDSFRYFER